MGWDTCSARLAAETPNSWIPSQFDNPANIEVHRDRTAQEILADFPQGIDCLIAGVGTGGHITGCAEALKKKCPRMKVFAVEPALSPVISGGKPSPHPIQGIGAGFIPENLHTDVLDGAIQIEKDEDQPEAVRSYAVHLVSLVRTAREEIDEVLAEVLEKWDLTRIAVIDRSVLRLATVEILFCHDVPVPVILNEAIEIAKRFGSAESGKFVNGILDRVARKCRPEED